jgi:short-subunit dehydrogenase
MLLRELKKKAVMAGVAVAGTGLACTGALVWCAAAQSARKLKTLQGRVVLITGASRGLGLALAEEFGKRGARLVLAARDMASLERARNLLVTRGAARRESDVLILSHDLRDAGEAEKLIQEATSELGQVDILVNNCGVITVGPVENQALEDFREVMDANFFSGVQCTLAVLPQMLARGDGSIVNITSVGGKIPMPHLLPYTASKFAAVGFSEGLNAELRSKGIYVTTVCPGLMRTGSHLNANFSGDAAREYRWFSFVAGLPGVSTSARSAARKIVRAVVARRSEIAITPQVILATRVAGVCPTATMRAMDMVNRVLPSSASGTKGNRRGAEVRSMEVKQAAFLVNAAARRYNQPV